VPDDTPADLDGLDADALAERVYTSLSASEELPLDRETNRWLGEAQAVAEDMRGDIPPETRRKRADQVLDLLGNVETDHPVASELVTAARDAAERIVDDG